MFETKRHLVELFDLLLELKQADRADHVNLDSKHFENIAAITSIKEHCMKPDEILLKIEHNLGLSYY